jgi:hypothetical protein
LQKKQLKKKHETAIATKKTVAKHTSKKSAAKKTSSKKAPCHDTVRLRLGWCLLDVVATW